MKLQSAPRSRNKLIILRFLAAFVVASAMIQPGRAATDTWTGAGADDNWLTSGNWSDVANAAPSAFDSLDFTGVAGLTSNNNFTANTQFDGITFDSQAGAFTLTGNGILISGKIYGATDSPAIGIVNSSTNNQIVDLPLTLDWGAYAIGNTSVGGLAINGALTANTGGIALLGDTGTGTGIVTTTSLTTDATGLISGLDGAGLIANSSTAGELAQLPLATVSSGQIVALGSSAYLSVAAGEISTSATADSNVLLTGNSANTQYTANDVANNGVTLANAIVEASGTSTLNVTGTLVLGSGAANGVGGIYVTGGVGNQVFTLSGGIVTAGTTSAGGEIVLADNSLAGNTANEMEINSTIANNGAGGVVAVVKTGIGSMYFNTVSTYSGGTYITEGYLQSNGAGYLGTGPIYVAGGATLYLETSQSNNLFISPGVGDTGNQGAVKLANNNIVLSGSIMLQGTAVTSSPGDRLTLNQNGDSVTFANQIAGGGTLDLDSQTGGGASFILDNTTANANNWTGGAIIETNASANSITVQLGASNQFGAASGTAAGNVTMIQSGTGGATLDLHGFNDTIGALISTGNGIVTNNGTNSSTLTVGDNGGSGTFAGTIQNGANAAATLAIVKTGTGIETLSGVDTYTGATTINNGAIELGSSNAAQDSVVVIGAANGLQFAGGIGSFVVGGLSGSAAENLTDTFTSGVNLEIGNNSGSTLTYSGILSGAGGLTQLGPGTERLTAANTYTGSTTTGGGTLLLDFSAAGAPASNIVSSQSSLTLGGGILNIKLASGNVVTTQTFNGLTVAQDSASQLVVTQNGNTNANSGVNLGQIERNTAGTVDFILPTAGSVTGVAPGLSGNGNIMVSSAGVAFATVNGMNWATEPVATILPLTVYQTGAANYLINNDINVGAGVASATDSPAAGFTVDTLRFNAAGLTLALSGTDTDNTGGILVTGSGISDTISGGAIQSGAGEELVIVNNGSLKISSVIADSTSGQSVLTISGTGLGTTTLTGSNTFTGATDILTGIVNYQNAGAFGLNSAITVNSGATAQVQGGIVGGGNTLTLSGSGAANATGALESVSGSNSYPGSISLNSNTVISVDAGSLSLPGAISGGGGLTKNGAGLLSLSNSTSSFSGNIIVNTGTLTAVGTIFTNGGNTTFGSDATAGRTITVNSGATLSFLANNIFGNGESSAGNIPAITLNYGTLTTNNYNVLGALSLNGAKLTGSNAGAGSYQDWEFLGPITVGGTAASTISNTGISATTGGDHLGSNTTFNVASTGAVGGDLIISAPLRNQSGDFANGAGALTKTGSGTLVFTGSNTFTGATTVNAGIINYQNVLAWDGSSSITVNSGASVQVQGSLNGGRTTPTLTLNNSAGASNAAGAVEVVSGSSQFNGPVTLTGTSIIAADSGATLLFSGNMTGSGGYTKVGSGVIAINNGGGSTYSGNVVVNSGTLEVYNGGNTSAGTSTLGAISGNGRTITINNGGTIFFASNNIFGNGEVGGTKIPTIIINPGGVLTTNNYDPLGNIILNGGTLTGNYTGSGSYQQYQLLGSVTVGGTNASTITSQFGSATEAGVQLSASTTIFNVGSTGAIGGDLIVSAPLTNMSGDFGNQAGILVKTGTGTMVLSGPDTYTGATTASNGIINYQNGLALGGSSAISVIAGATVQVQGSIVGGTQSLTLAGPGAANATGALENISGINSYAGIIALTGSTTISSDAGSLSLSNTGTITGSGNNLTLTGGGAGSIAGIIGTGGGALTKTGAGAWTLTGASTYTGTTSVLGGTLLLGGNGGINGSSGITVAGIGAKFVAASSLAVSATVSLNQGTVDGTGVINAVTVADSASNIVQNGNGGTAALTIGNLAFNGAGAIDVNDSGVASVAGLNIGTLTTALVNEGGILTINAISGFGWANGTTYDLLNYGNIVADGTGANDNILVQVEDLTPRQDQIVAFTGTDITLTISGDSPKWTGSDNGNWVVGTTGSNDNWQLITAHTPTNYIQGDNVLFDDTATTGTVNISAANVLPTATLFNNNKLNYTLSSGSGFGIAGSGGLAKSGTGTLTIKTPNTFTGVTTINAGIVNYQNGTAFGNNSAITVAANATAQVQGGITGGTNTLTLSGSGAANATGALENVSGNNSYAGQIALNANTIISSDAGTLTLNGMIGGGNALTTTGTGTIVFTAPNSFAGATTINEGVVLYENGAALGTNSAITINNGGTAQVEGGITSGGQALTISGPGSVGATGALENVSGANTYNGAITLASDATISSDSGSLTLNGLLSGSNNLTTAGAAGSVILTDFANALTGNIIVNSGTLMANALGNTGTSSVLGSLALSNRTITINNGGTLDFIVNNIFGNGDNGANGLNPNDSDIPSITVNAGGVLLTTRYNVVGNITLDDGALVTNNTVDFGNYQGWQFLGTITAGGTSASTISSLAVNGTNEGNDHLGSNTTFNVGITGASGGDLIVSAPLTNESKDFGNGTGILTKTGLGTMVLSGSNSFTGATNIQAGIVNYQNGVAFGGGSAITVSSGATAQVQGGITGGTNTLTISGAGAANATGALENVSGTNGYTGLLALAGNATLSSDAGLLTLSNTGTITGAGDNLTLAGAGNGNIASIIGTGAGTLVMSGSGTWTLSAPNTFTGATTVSSGILNYLNGTAFGTNSAITVNPGGTAQVTGTITGGINTLTLAGPGAANGTGALDNVSGTNTYPGPITLAGNTTISSDAGMLVLSGGIGGGNNLATAGAAGTVSLTGSSTYSGATIVQGGTLLLGGSGSINGTSGITVNGNGAIFVAASSVVVSPTVTISQGTVDGTGVINAVTVANLLANTVQNGNGGTGALTIGNLTFNGAGTIDVNDSNTPATAGLDITGALTTGFVNASGTVAIDASDASGWTNGNTYDLVNFGTLAGSGSADIVKGTVANLLPGQSANLVVTGSEIELVIAGDSPKWTALDNDNWVVGVTGSHDNWKLINSGSAVNYVDADVVLFDDSVLTGSANYNGTINISATNVNPTSTTFNNNKVNYTLTSGSGFGIAAGTLTKNGTGTLTIETPNAFTGATMVNGGIVNFQNGTAFGVSSAITVVSGASVQVQGSIAGGAELLALSGTGASNATGALENVSGNNSYSGPIDLTGNTTISSDSGSLVLGGTISGASDALTIGGTGAVTLSAVENYTGNTIINGATVTLDGHNSSNTSIGSLDSPNIYVNAGGTLVLTLNDTLGFTGGINALVINDGELYNSVAADRDTLANTVVLTGGTIAAAGLGNNGGAFSWFVNGGGLVATSDTNGNPAVISAATTLQTNGTWTVNRGPAVTGTSPDLVVSGALNQFGTGIALAITGSGFGGITVFAGANGYTGATTIENGIVDYENGTAFGNKSVITVDNGATAQVQGGVIGGSLTLTIVGAGDTGLGATGALESIAGNNFYSGPISLSGNSTIAVDSGEFFISGGISGNSALTTTGIGEIVFDGTNSYSGGITVENGLVSLDSAENPGVSGPLGEGGSVVLAGGTLQYSFNNQYDYSSRFSTGANQQFNIDTDGRIVTFATALSSSGGSLNLNDSQGNGALILAAANTYTGSTTVQAGTLFVTGSLNGTSSTTVAGNGISSATLEGSGSIANAVAIGNGLESSSTAIIEPATLTGTSSGITIGVGTLTIGGTLTLNSDAAYLFNLDSTNGGSGSGASELIAKAVSLNSGAEFSFNDLASTQGTLNPGTNFVAIFAPGGLTGEFGDLANASQIISGPNTYDVNYTSTELTLTVVPEPGTWGLMISGFGLLIGIQKLRKRLMGI